MTDSDLAHVDGVREYLAFEHATPGSLATFIDRLRHETVCRWCPAPLKLPLDSPETCEDASSRLLPVVRPPNGISRAGERRDSHSSPGRTRCSTAVFPLEFRTLTVEMTDSRESRSSSGMARSRHTNRTGWRTRTSAEQPAGICFQVVFFRYKSYPRTFLAVWSRDGPVPSLASEDSTAPDGDHDHHWSRGRLEAVDGSTGGAEPLRDDLRRQTRERRPGAGGSDFSRSVRRILGVMGATAVVLPDGKPSP